MEMKNATNNINSQSLNRIALSATIHCLTGCSIGEVLGMILGKAWGMSNIETITLAVILAFLFGYLFTLIPLLRLQIPLRRALGLTLAADTVSITAMEIVDNAMMWGLPGAMDAGIDDLYFWTSMGISLFVAGIVAFFINRKLIARGSGHALVHHVGHHHGSANHAHEK